MLHMIGTLVFFPVIMSRSREDRQADLSKSHFFQPSFAPTGLSRIIAISIWLWTDFSDEKEVFCLILTSFVLHFSNYVQRKFLPKRASIIDELQSSDVSDDWLTWQKGTLKKNCPKLPSGTIYGIETVIYFSTGFLPACIFKWSSQGGFKAQAVIRPPCTRRSAYREFKAAAYWMLP